jgi:hypothetical protein
MLFKLAHVLLLGSKPLQLLAVIHGLHQMVFILLLWFVLVAVVVVVLIHLQPQVVATLTL